MIPHLPPFFTIMAATIKIPDDGRFRHSCRLTFHDLDLGRACLQHEMVFIATTPCLTYHLATEFAARGQRAVANYVNLMSKMHVRML